MPMSGDTAAATAAGTTAGAIAGAAAVGSLAVFWVDPAAGNDTTGTGTFAAPFLTIAKADSLCVAGNRIAIKLGSGAGPVVIKENVALSGGGHDNRIFLGNGCVFQAYDTVVPTWTNMGSNIWKCTINLTVGVGGSAAHGTANKEYTGLFANNTNCIVNNATGTQSEATILAALAAAVDYSYSIRNGPVVGGTSSGTTNGFVWGNHDFYVKLPASVTDPTTLAWKVQQRRQPAFGNGWTFETGFSVFGGWAHNGVEMTDANWKDRITIWYPSNHGSFICGGQGVGPIIRGRNNTGAAGYAYHLYNGGARKRWTRPFNPKAYDYGFSTNDKLFGGHGSNQGTDICEGLEVFELEAYNCYGVGGAGDTTAGSTYGPLTYGCIYHNPKLIGCLAGDFAAGGDIYNPTIVHTGTAAAWSAPSAGKTINIYGGTTGGNPQGIFFNNAGVSGTLNFFDHTATVGGERTNARWWSSTAACTVSFTRCGLEGKGVDDHSLWGQQSTSTTVNFTDTAMAGLTPPTGAVFTRTQRGGDLGLVRGPQGEALVSTRDLAQALGEEIIGTAWPLTSTANYVAAYALTASGIYVFQPNTAGVANNPKWTALNAYTLSGLIGAFKSSVADWVVAYGKDGSNNAVILRYNVNDAVGASPVAVDLTTPGLTGKTITGAVTGGTDGKVWFGCSDGSIIEVDMSSTGGSGATPLGVARTSGVTYPLLGGVRNGATILMVGSDAAGSAATVGGAVISSDTGATWASSLASADSTPSGIGAWSILAKCAVYVAGVYVIFGARGTMLTSVTAASGTWTSRTVKTDADLHTAATPLAAADARILVGGKPGLGLDYKGQRLLLIDASAKTGNELVGQKTAYDPASIASGAQSSTTVTVTGAALGDQVADVSLSISNAGLLIEGEITSANTVTVTYSNLTGGAVDLASHTINVEVRPRADDPAAFWSIRHIASPVSHIGARVLCGTMTVGPSSITQWMLPGKLREMAFSEDGGVWRRAEWPSPPRTLLTSTATVLASMLAL